MTNYHLQELLNQSNINDVIAALDRAAYIVSIAAIKEPMDANPLTLTHIYHLRELRNALLKDSTQPFSNPD